MGFSPRLPAIRTAIDRGLIPAEVLDALPAAPDPPAIDCTEDVFTAAAIQLAQSAGWLAFHARPARTAAGWRTPVQGDGEGFPDLLLVRERVVFAELKAERGRLRSDQERWLDRLRGAGAEVHVWKPRQWPAIVEALAAERPAGKLVMALADRVADQAEILGRRAERPS